MTQVFLLIIIILLFYLAFFTPERRERRKVKKLNKLFGTNVKTEDEFAEHVIQRTNEISAAIMMANRERKSLGHPKLTEAEIIDALNGDKGD